MYTVGEKVFCCQGHPEFTKEIMHVMLPRVADSLADGARVIAVKLFDEVEPEPEPVRSMCPVASHARLGHFCLGRSR